MKRQLGACLVQSGPAVRTIAASRPLSKLVCLLGATLLGVGGCASGKTSTITVTKEPVVKVPGLKRVSIMPFENRTNVPGASERLTDRIEVALINNRSYEVYTRQQLRLRNILDEADMAAAGIVRPDVAQRIGNLAAVQALVCGVYSRCSTDTQQETRMRQVPLWGTDAKGKATIVGYDQQPYIWTRHSAVVDCKVDLIDTGTGKQWIAFNQPITRYCEGSPPRYGPAQVLQITEDAVVQAILETLAWTRKSIRLTGTPLKVARDFYDQKWEYARTVSPRDKELIAVVSLPAEAAGNSFKLTIVEKEGREILADREFKWERGNGTQGYKFPIDQLVQKAGFGAFKAKLYSGPEPIAWVDFAIAADPNKPGK